MAEKTNSEFQAGVQAGIEIAVQQGSAAILSPEQVAEQSKWYRWRKDGTALAKYLLDSEVHTFAFSVAANAILSFLPFIVLLYTLAASVFKSAAMVQTITDMVAYFFPSNQGFVATSLAGVAGIDLHKVAFGIQHPHRVQFFSIVMILVACTGIFLPLEVALNQAWGVTKSRNYLANQVVALGLAFLMVILGFSSIFVTSLAGTMFGDILLGHSGWIGTAGDWLYSVFHFVVLAISTGIASILFFFCIYWLLPNRKVPWKPVLRTSVITGLIWLLSKYVFVEWLLPHLDLKELYGAFSVSVGLIFWAYATGLILFAGAQFSVSKMGVEVQGD